MILLLDRKLLDLLTDKNRFHVIDHLLNVLKSLASGLIVRLTLFYATQFFVALWRALRCSLRFQDVRLVLMASAPVDGAVLNIDNFKVFNLVSLSFRIAIQILMADSMHQR